MPMMISAQTARRAVWRPLWQLPQRFDLILSLTKRELAARYRGSALGVAWAVLTPIVMIAIFTIIFAGIFKARFGTGTSQWDYALYLFCGLLPWTAFQESVQLSSSTIVGHANLVKRVVFPLETLPVSLSLAAAANQMFGTVALVLAAVLLRREMHATIVFLPLLLIPQLLATFGAAWLLASLGVFVRDIVQGITLFLLAWMYLTPIIYPESLVPERYQGISSNDISKVLPGPCKPPISKQKAECGEDRKICEASPIRKVALQNDPPIVSNQWREGVEVHDAPIASRNQRFRINNRGQIHPGHQNQHNALYDVAHKNSEGRY